MIMIIYVAGNLLVEKDSLPLKIMPRLQKMFPKIEFKEFEPTEDFPKEKDLVIIDAVEGIDEVRLLEDIEKIEFSGKYSLHDFDLGSNLKLLKKIGELDSVKIICVPIGMDELDAIGQIAQKIKEILSDSDSQ